MMLATPRIVVIDDEPEHLLGLADCLNQQGFACLRVHFTGDPAGVTACPDVRIIFADLHLGMGSPSDHKINFGMIDGLLRDSIKPSGPYVIILWTQFPEQADELRAFLERPETEVVTPFDVRPLAKADHLDADGHVKDQDALVNAIDRIVRDSPQLAAMFDWEARVLGATGRTVSSILELAGTAGMAERGTEVGSILTRLAIEAVGAKNVNGDRFRAVNEALLPILADRVSALRSSAPDQELWSQALEPIAGLPGLSLENAARLNSLVHIADADETDVTERGVVAGLPGRYQRRFERCFGISEADAATDEFRCQGFDRDDARFRWVLVQCEAACDHAQAKPGTLPFFLGLVFPAGNAAGMPPMSTWRGPALHLDGDARLIRVSARFPVALPRSYAPAVTPLFRLREQMLNHLTYHIHTHGARPGTIEFRGQYDCTRRTPPDHAAATSDRTTASITGGQTPFPNSLTRSRRVPSGRSKSSPRPIARLSSGT